MQKSEGHKMVEIAVDLMTNLVSNEAGLGPREISRTFNISTSAAHRLVTSLERKKFLQFEESTKKYKIGIGALRFSRGVMGKSDIIHVAQPYMERLCKVIDETICLNTVVDNKRMTIFQVESNQELRYTTKIGKLYPIYIGASGKAILAHMSDSQRDMVIKENVTNNQYEELVKELEKVRKENYSISYGERISGGIGIAVPFRVNNSLFSLSIYAPTSRMNDNLINDMIIKLQQIVKQIEDEVS